MGALPLEPHPQSARALLKCFLSTLKHVAHGFANRGRFQATAFVRDRRQFAGPSGARTSDYYLISVCINDEIRVVSNDDYLPPQACLRKQTHELVENRLRIKILFRLINDERAIIGIVESKIK